MLNELHIENIAVIEKADIEFSGGLNILTGETGAGKSIVIDSIGAVLGERVSKELVRRGAEKGVVTAVFNAEGCEKWLEENGIESDDELIIQRRITSDGKSSCRICGCPATAAQLKELAALLVDIHGQNDGRQLMDEKRHLAYLDGFAAIDEQYALYRAEYEKYRAIRKEIDSLSMDNSEKERLRDTLTYQIAELERANVQPGEADALASRRDLLRNSEKLTEALEAAIDALCGGEDNALSLTQNAAYYVGKASAFASELEGAAAGLNDAAFALSDASETLRDFLESLDFSPDEYDNIESRLFLIGKLERKYGRLADELPELLDQCRRKLDDIEYADDRIAKLERDLSLQKQLCLKEDKKLSGRRKKAAEELEKRIVSELRDLSMPSVRFSVEFASVENEAGFDKTGMDAVRFLMSANAGEEPGRISKIASGGELSRIMLAMKNVFAENDPVGTMIFDEIDTGVSGIAAQRVAEKLYTVSLGKQVMCVTHLPQIAAMGDHQYLIKKEEKNGRTYTRVDRLDEDGRAYELARLHGGDNISELTLASAREQLASCERFRKEKAGKA